MQPLSHWQKFIPSNISAIQRCLGLAKFLSCENFQLYTALHNYYVGVPGPSLLIEQSKYMYNGPFSHSRSYLLKIRGGLYMEGAY